MADEYKPTRREVLEEMMRGDCVSKATKPLRDFTRGFVKGYGLLATLPYFIPTFVRCNKKGNNNILANLDAPGTENVGGTIGAILGGISTFCQAIYATGLAFGEFGGHREYLLIPLATNALSGVYEIGRNSYLNAKAQVIKKYKEEPKEGPKVEPKAEPKAEVKEEPENGVVKTAEERVAEPKTARRSRKREKKEPISI
jgi:hypothetical protein